MNRSVVLKSLGLVIGKLSIFLMISWWADYFIPYKGAFSFPDVLDGYALPAALKALANFDGIHYILIASKGYYQFGHAFFPLYPVLISLFAWLFFNNYLLTGLVLSNIFLVVMIVVAKKWLQYFLNSAHIKWFVIFLLAFPTAFFLQSLYTESLFLVLVFGSFLFLERKVWWLAGACALLAALTRIVGVFLVIPLVFYWWPVVYKPQRWLAVMPFLGLGLYMFYLWQTTGDAVAFFHAQSAFGAGRSAQLVLLPQVYFRYLKIFLQSEVNFTYVISLLEFALFSLVFVLAGVETWFRWKLKEWKLVCVGLFSLATLLLPTLTGTLLSTPRFALVSIATFLCLTRIEKTYLKISLIVLFGLLQVALFAFFSQGYFVS